MSNPYIWSGLERANNDPTTIDEAIGEAITAHNDDPDAHLGDGQALESHRASEIIDHRAESVVNDKLARVSRRYMAIVDPSSESDFDTLAEAVDFCESNGYGDIYVTAGTHYIDAELYVDARISIYGAGQEETKIVSNTGEFSYIIFTDAGAAGANWYCSQIISGITFGANNNGVGFMGSSRDAGIVFEDCYFKYIGEEMNFQWNSPVNGKFFIRCNFEVRSTTGVFWGYYCNFEDCNFTVTGLPSGFISGYHFKFTRCSFYQSSLAGSYSFWGNVSGNIRFFQCSFGGCKVDTGTFSQSPATGLQIFDSCHFFLFTSARVRIASRGLRFVNNRCEHGAGNSPLVVSGTVNAAVIGNQSTAAISDSGTTTALLGNNLI